MSESSDYERLVEELTTQSYDATIATLRAKNAELLTRLREVEADIEKLKNPEVVHMGMLRGGIAMPSPEAIEHIYQDRLPSISKLSTSQALLEECREVLKPFSRMKKDFDDCADNQPLVIEIPAHDIYQDFAVEDIRRAASLIEKLEGMG